MRSISGFKRKHLSIPYAIFLVLFVIVPIFLIVFYAFTDNAGNFPSGEAFVKFFSDTSKLNVLLVSLFFAVETTIICLLIGYPVAAFLADKKVNKNVVLYFMFIMPMWINFVLRVGATRDLLTWLGINGGNHPYLATIIGMVYDYLPFVILPLYTSMLKIDHSQLEAAADLGANPVQVFVRSYFPQTIPGLGAAATMVFLPCMSNYVISDVLSEGKITLLGNSIYTNFSNSQWNNGSFMALIMLILVAITLLVSYLFKKETKEGNSTKGGNLW